jgi:CIC family chloride channel protein
MIRSTLKMERFLNKRKNPYSKAIWGGIAHRTVIIFIFPPLYGEGYGISNQLMAGNYESLFNNSLFFAIQRQCIIPVLGFTLAMILVKVFAAARSPSDREETGESLVRHCLQDRCLGFSFPI